MVQNTILIVDDMEVNRALLCNLFQEEYDVMEAGDGEEAIKLIEENTDAIVTILLDIVMPNVDGFQVLDILQQKNLLFRIPVVLITGDTSMDAEQKAYDYGVADLITKPFNTHIVKRRVQNIVDLYQYKNNLEIMVADQTEKLQAQAQKLKDTNIRIIDTMSTIVEFRNLESGEHIKRIKGFTKVLTECVEKYYPIYGLTQDKINVITEASAMHDVGKIAIEDCILLKPGKLTKDEFEVMKSHTTKGCEIISAVAEFQDEEYMQYAYEICRHHHERYDGHGYPDGLKGENIPIAAQIVSVADVYDALVSERVYKSAYTPSQAFTMIQQGECGIFSPRILECLKYVRGDFELMANHNR